MPSRPTSRPRRYLLPLFALIVLAAGGWYAWKKYMQPVDPRAQYQIVQVQRGDIEDLVTATGTLQPRDYVDVGAQVSGQLKQIHVEVGSLVERGDLLAEIDPTVLTANVDAARAGLRSLQANLQVREAALALAQQQFQRQKNLAAEDATTQDALQSAENTLRSAEAQLAAQKASIEQTQSTLRASEANLNYARIYAPISGVVVSITARQGQTLNANQSAPVILRVADLSTMLVQTQVSEADVGRLRTGMPVYFTTLGSQGQRYHGRLRKVEPTPTVTNNVVLYNALFDVPNTNRSLMTSMTAQVFFIAAQARDTLLVPAAAIQGGQRGARRQGEGPPAGGGAAGGAAARVAAASAPAAAASATPPVPPASSARRTATSARERNAVAGSADQRAASVRTPDQAAAPVDRGLFTGPGGMGQRGPRRATVRVIDAAGKVEERQVQIGLSNRVQVQILSGLAEGEEVIAGVRQTENTPAAAGPQRSGLQQGGMPPGMGGMPGGAPAGARR